MKKETFIKIFLILKIFHIFYNAHLLTKHITMIPEILITLCQPKRFGDEIHIFILMRNRSKMLTKLSLNLHLTRSAGL